MANPEHVEIVKQGAEKIREWRAENPDLRLDLSNAECCGADLSGADLSGADLSGADLTNANLFDANLSAVVGRASRRSGRRQQTYERIVPPPAPAARRR